ncbi:type I-F CRISPR-associated endoribonuclease Cas6/Csy4 [Betaproteobacteria bacterium]|nr:type I-F CRISPR-associated endoribonuclease Cas6/Csy4 [Betaproteobacteria bacterium]GHU48361.1 type I-F CRISPR-associated endoribonuclease Cas6/Csy4 [Betaproteobacteria bacterium]
MDHYLDIHLRPDPELPGTHLMATLFAKLHSVLVALATQNIGVSFPQIDKSPIGLGEHLRLHGTAAALDALMARPWLNGLHDYLSLGEKHPVPTKIQFRAVRRVQTKSSSDRLRRRQIRRHGLSEEEARERIPDSAAKTLALPYLQLRSQSTGQHFRLFIQHGELQTSPVDGVFNSYGLSQQATIPWF